MVLSDLDISGGQIIVLSAKLLIVVYNPSQILWDYPWESIISSSLPSLLENNVAYGRVEVV
jgi:hypothetical protein